MPTKPEQPPISDESFLNEQQISSGQRAVAVMIHGLLNAAIQRGEGALDTLETAVSCAVGIAAKHAGIDMALTRLKTLPDQIRREHDEMVRLAKAARGKSDG